MKIFHSYLVLFMVICALKLDYCSAHNILEDEQYPPYSKEDSLQIDIHPKDKVNVVFPGESNDMDDQSSLDTWSVIWYIASFGGLVLFFLIVSCSEWCCRRNARRNCQRGTLQATPEAVPDTPPPSYDLFAPPKYDDLWVGSSRGRCSGEKGEYEVYVVPIDALGPMMEQAHRQDTPPSYQIAALPQVHQS